MSITNTIVMVSPDQFGFNSQTAQTNSFQHHLKLNNLQLKKKAIKEFNNMVVVLKKEGINVLTMPSRKDAITPDAVFPNNWFSHHRDGRLVIYPMMAENRRLEKRTEDLQKLLYNAGINHIKVTDLSDDEKHNLFLEGTGSLVLDRSKKIAFAVESPRTNKKEFNKWCQIMKFDGVYFHASGPNSKPIYHTNVLMSIGEEFAVVCTEAIKSNEDRVMVEKKLASMDKKIIPISMEQMDKFCGNIIQLTTSDKKRKIIMSSTAYEGFDSIQKNMLGRWGKLVAVSIPTIETIGGGSARCMIAEIFNTD